MSINEKNENENHNINENIETEILNFSDLYSKTYPIKVEKYWFRKLYGSTPAITFKKNGEIIRDINFYKYIPEYKLITFLKRVEGKIIKEGRSIATIDVIINNYGERNISLNIGDEVVWSEKYDQEIFIQTIRNVQRGTFPIIQFITYGTHRDIVEYRKLDESFAKSLGIEPFDYSNLSKDENKKLNKDLENKSYINHNLGIVRAQVFTNNVNHLHWNGRPEIEPAIWDRIRRMDYIYSRIYTKIDLETTHLAIFKDEGSSLGGEDVSKLKNSLSKDVKTRQAGATKISFIDNENADGIDSTVLEGSPDIKSLSEWFEREEIAVDKLLGISDDYNSLGKTNDTESKSDKVGDSANLEGNNRQHDREQQIKIFVKKIAFILGEEFKNIDEIEVDIIIRDYRKQMQMLKYAGEISKILTHKTMLREIFGMSEQQAEQEMITKEEEIHTSLTSFLSNNNGNLSENIKFIKDLKFIDYEKIEEQENNNNFNNENNTNNENENEDK